MSADITLNTIKKEIVLPALRENSAAIGKVCKVDVSLIENSEQFKKREGILSIFDEGPLKTITNARDSSYYRHLRLKKKLSVKKSIIKIVRYYLLFWSVKKRGFISDINRPESLPCLFVSKKAISRFDGHHRTSVAKFMGYSEIPVLIITPKDILGLKNLTRETKEFLGKLGEPDKEWKSCDNGMH